MSKEEKQSSFLDLGANDKKGELLRWVNVWRKCYASS